MKAMATAATTTTCLRKQLRAAAERVDGLLPPTMAATIAAAATQMMGLTPEPTKRLAQRLALPTRTRWRLWSASTRRCSRWVGRRMGGQEEDLDFNELSGVLGGALMSSKFFVG